MIDITLPRNELKDAVAGFTKVITCKSTLPVLGCVRFDTDSDGIVAQVTDLDQTVEYRFNGSSIRRGGACIVPLASLKDLAKGSKTEQVEIKQESPLHLVLTNNVAGHAVRQVIGSMELDEWPTLQSSIETEPASGFIEAYRRLLPFSSTDETRQLITGVYVEVGKGTKPITMTATDGRRLVSQNSMSLPINQSIIVPASKFLQWSKLPGDPEVGVRDDDGQTWLGVKAGPFTYTVKTIDGTYPNYRQVIPAEPGAHTVTFVDSDVGLLKQVLPTTFPGKEEITLVGCDGKVTVYGRGMGDAQWETVRLEKSQYEGERVFIALNRHYLLDALQAGFREFCITDALSPVLSRNGDSALHVLMPMRSEDPEGEAEPQPAAVAETKPDAAAGGAESNGDTTPSGSPATEKPGEKAATTGRRTKVTKQTEQTNTESVLDRVLAACNEAKTKVKEAGQALSALNAAIKEAAKEQKTQAKEVESARTALAKLQAISL